MASPSAPPSPNDPTPATENATWKRRTARRVVLLVAALALVLIGAAFLHRGQDESKAPEAPTGVIGHPPPAPSNVP